MKRCGGAGRTSVSQSWKVTGHFVRLYLRPSAQAMGTIGEFSRKMARPAGFEPATLGLEGRGWKEALDMGLNCPGIRAWIGYP